MTETLTGLSALAGRYDALLCDVWGVIHNGRESFAAPCEALARWRESVGPVVLISNSPRPSAEVAAQLDGLGVARAPGPAYRLGPPRDAPLYAGLGLDFVPLEEAKFIACTGPVDDDVETPEDYRALLTTAAARRLPMICANPDKVVQRGDRLVYCGGALAELAARRA